MNTATLASDIPLETARAAFRGISWTPEKRGDQTVSEYVKTLEADYADLEKCLAGKPELAPGLAVEFERYRQGYRKRYLAYLHSNARCVSSAIAGPSNFPVRRMEKRNNIAMRRLSELVDFRNRALAAIRRGLYPELAPIMAGDEDACARLTSKIQQAERLQNVMRDTNKAMRQSAHAGPVEQAKTMAGVLLAVTDGDRDKAESYARKLLKPDFCGRVGFADFELTNNNANIRRMKARLESIAAAKAAPSEQEDGEHARFEDSPAENRVRLFFPGKPSEEVRTRLKSAGFRWAPTLGCWQAYRHASTIQTAKDEAGLVDPAAVPAAEEAS